MDYMHNRNFILRFLAIGMAVILVICGALSWKEMRVKEISIDGIPVLEESDGARVTVESCDRAFDSYKNKHIIQVGGFAYIKGRETTAVTIHVLLRDEYTGKVYQLPTSMRGNAAITELEGDGVNYDNCGFSVGMYTTDKELTNNRFRVLILYSISGEEYIMETDGFLEYVYTEG